VEPVALVVWRLNRVLGFNRFERFGRLHMILTTLQNL
jgi:hypothetical protein